MSKAFTKDDDSGLPPLVPRRAPLPPGVPNYVTARGLAALRSELAELFAELTRTRAAPAEEGAARERARELAVLGERAAELEDRIASAELVPVPAQPPPEVRFGATVSVRDQEGREKRFELVGIDEADARRGRIAFIAPLARALLGKRVGERAVVRTPQGEEELELVALVYDGAGDAQGAPP